jgi:hypothetical protein
MLCGMFSLSCAVVAATGLAMLSEGAEEGSLGWAAYLAGDGKYQDMGTKNPCSFWQSPFFPGSLGGRGDVSAPQGQGSFMNQDGYYCYSSLFSFSTWRMKAKESVLLAMVGRATS